MRDKARTAIDGCVIAHCPWQAAPPNASNVSAVSSLEYTDLEYTVHDDEAPGVGCVDRAARNYAAAATTVPPRVMLTHL